MGNRSIEIFQTDKDVQAFLDLEQSRSGMTLRALSAKPSESCPMEIPFNEAVLARTFLLTTDEFLSQIRCRSLGDGRSYVDQFASEVVLVEPSAVSDRSVERGRYWMTTHRLESSGEKLKMIAKSQKFIKWTEGLFRLVKSKATLREANPGYKYFFAPNADALINNSAGQWGPQSVYLMDVTRVEPHQR